MINLELTGFAVGNNQQIATPDPLSQFQHIWTTASPADRLEVINFLEQEMQKIDTLANGDVLVVMSDREWQALQPPAGSAPADETLPPDHQTIRCIQHKRDTGRLSVRAANVTLRWLAAAGTRHNPEFAPLLALDNFLALLAGSTRLPFKGGGSGTLAELRQAFDRELNHPC
ncbi:MAG: hypothetical protein FOGNACKC_05468 [Anaerolineae bacterium]|nr:hypothetical protein [Anaerolineae bacterium]